ncbi:MAG TPA: AlkA N-terminal domain-containing protein [Polyangiales bacterium]|nr:AlkA N-terminal domain-containing protein [Polyangiales bacterium]
MDDEARYRALTTRDPRFDGRLFTGVTSTGVYCRPICPARTPKRENCRFFSSAAAAQSAGFRPCLRCRPERSPELASYRGTGNTVSRALALIESGALDGEDVDALAARVGVGERQLRRLFVRHLGAAPGAIAQTRRVLLAKQLIHDSTLPMSQVALAAGFQSVRRFNETFQQLYARSPSCLRRHRREGAERLTLRLAYVPPYDWESMLGFLAARAIPGVEHVSEDRYARTVALDGAQGTIEVRPSADAVQVTVSFPRLRALPSLLAGVRRVFDLGADPHAIAHHLAADGDLAPLVHARPGMRVPGAWDGFELAVRGVLGQQITVQAATALAARLVERHGTRLQEARGQLTHVFPTPQQLAGADLSWLPMPRARSRCLGSLAQAFADEPQLLLGHASLEDAVARLRALPGIGEWTAQYIAMRALAEPDAFPAADVALQRALQRGGVRPNAKQLRARAEAWRPWRAYAALHLWSSLATLATRAA